MVALSDLWPPPWSRRRERCPGCLAKVPDEKALVCDHCGYQLRLPRVAVVGLLLIVAAIGAFFGAIFGDFLFPFPGMPFGLKVPFLESPTPDDLRAIALWAGVLLLLVGIAAASAGAYAVRRRADRVIARGA